MTLLINPEDPGKDGLIADISSSAAGTLPEFYNADGPIPLHIRCLTAADGVIPWSEDYETGDSYLVSVGNVDDKPTGGTFTIDVGGSISSALQFDSTAAAIQTAVSTVSTAEGLGTVTVTLMEEGVYSIDWNFNGAVPEVVVDVTYLRPQCEASVEVFRVGSGSQRARQVITIRRTAVASATVSTVYTQTEVSCTQIQSVTQSSNSISSINWGDAYAGSTTFYVNLNEVTADIALTPSMTLEEIGQTIGRVDGFNYQAEGVADNIALSKVDGRIYIEFVGTLSAATLARTIVSNTPANPTVITTSADHGYVVGQSVTIPTNNGSSASIAGTHTITAKTADTFTIAINCTGSGGTGGSVYSISHQPSVGYDAGDANTIYALGKTGTISFATQALADEFYSTDADSLDFRLHVKRLRGAASNTILSTPITLHRELINGATLSSPVDVASAFVKKTELGTNVFTWLGTPSGANLASALTSALPASKGGTGLTALGAGVATWLGTPSSANLASAVTGGTGSGALVFGTSPTITTPVIANINPGADFSITNNSVAAFKSINASATVNTLVLNAGQVGIGTAAPSSTMEVLKSGSSGPRIRFTNSHATSRNVGFQLCYGATPSVGWQFYTDAAGSGGTDFGIASGDAGTFSPRITLTPTTSTIAGGIIGEVQALSGAGAVNLTSLSTDYTSTGAAQALTLANGTVGQMKTITHIVDGGSGVLTPTTKTGYTTITFTNAGDSVTLRYCTTAGWCVIGSFGVTIA